MRLFILILAVLAGLAAVEVRTFAQERSETLPLPRIMEIVTSRYVGSVIDVDIKGQRRREIEDERSGVVYEVRLLTTNGHILRIRVDAYTGAFLEVDGHGFIEALRP